MRIDPWDGVGSLSQSLGPDSGSVVALACHPSRPLVSVSLANGSIELWDYQGVCMGQGGGGRLSLGSGAGVDPGLTAGGDAYPGAPGAASPPGSPSKARGTGKGGKEEK